jgi:hypothetical protein
MCWAVLIRRGSAPRTWLCSAREAKLLTEWWVRPVERIRIGTIAPREDTDGNHANILEILPDYLPAR